MEIREELELQLQKLNGYIKNCEFDLQGLFPDSAIIKNKLLKLQEQKFAVERKLEAINNEQTTEMQ